MKVFSRCVKNTQETQLFLESGHQFCVIYIVIKASDNFLCLESVCQSGKSANLQTSSLCFTFSVDAVYLSVQSECSILGAKKQSCLYMCMCLNSWRASEVTHCSVFSACEFYWRNSLMETKIFTTGIILLICSCFLCSVFFYAVCIKLCSITDKIIMNTS